MKKDKRPAKQEPVMAMDPTSQRVLNELEKSQKTGEAVATDVEDGKRPAHLTFILDALRKDEVKRQNRMAFEVDPDTARGNAGHLYQQKVGLTPDHVLKRITGPQGDDLVNQILQARSNMVSSFGRPRTSRFDVGFEFQEISENKEKSDDQQKNDLREVEKLKEVLWNCGYKGLNEGWSPNLSQTLKMITRDGLAYGRIAIEFIYSKNPTTGKDQVHSFRAVDAATIYKIIPSQQHDQTRRNQAIQLLQQIQNKKFDQSLYERDEYKWVQVVGGKPIQVFSDKELVVYTLYPTTNIEYNGYPLTPIDQALNAIATHINITIHNKMYFENGRASRGMMIIQSDDLGEAEIQKIKLQFHQSINSVGNSWRMPVFGVGSQDSVTWTPIDNSGRDKEFQFLSDDTARVILGAFQISPEELPGYAHLSKGSSTQTLSESNNEYQLTAARDVGLRPLLYDIQDLFNTHIVPKFNEDLSKTHQFVLAGLEEDDPEKESTRLQQDMAVHMTYDNVLTAVEKDKIGAELGGDFPLNQAWQQSIAPYLTVGTIMENFFGVKGAAQDPRYNYIRDPFWLQYQQLILQKAQMAMQQQMMQMQQAQASLNPSPDQGGDQGDGSGEPPPQSTGNAEEDTQKTELWLEKNYQLLAKNTKNNHDTISGMILKRHTEITMRSLEDWRKKSEQAVQKILDISKPKKD
jgi:hypothetical protein